VSLSSGQQARRTELDNRRSRYESSFPFSEGVVRRFVVAVSASFAFIALGACSNPCERLQKKLCDCPGERAKAACAEAKKRREMRDKEALDKDRCRDALAKLRCEDLK
jgi:hypothetical protein